MARYLMIPVMLVAASVAVLPLFAAERHVMPPRVPPGQLQEARAMKNPLPPSPEVVAQGKVLYEGKGGCANCHGVSGRGDGPAGKSLDPSPRDFHHHGLWKHRTDGELLWVIKHGIAGTAMIPFGSMLSDEDIWAIIHYERTFASRDGMGPPGGKGPRARQ